MVQARPKTHAKKKPSSRGRRSSGRQLQAPKGVHDVIFPQSEQFEHIREVTKSMAAFFGYQFVELPLFEFQDLFDRSVGKGTDIVEKELYAFRSRGGDRLALRPEATAGMVRSYIQNGMANLPQPVKLWTWGPMFRYDNPQAGRYRQFWQIDFEHFTSADPVVDAEIMLMGLMLLRELGVTDVAVSVNSIGCSDCRPLYRKALKSYYRSRKRKLCPDCKKRFASNILRLLDCKVPSCQAFKQEAPQFLDFLCKNCCAHFRRVLEYLEEAGIQYVLDRFLVRGLDYYNRTVFEFSAPDPAAKESPEGIRPSVLALGGGGRYDPLMKLLGGPDTPAVGVAFGVDRLAEFTERIHPDTITETVDVFLIQIGDVAKTTLIKALGELRKARVRIGFDLGRDSLRAQLKSADRLKARFSVILGEKEVFDRTFILRDMATGIQETFPQTRLVEVLKGHLHHHVS